MHETTPVNRQVQIRPDQLVGRRLKEETQQEHAPEDIKDQAVADLDGILFGSRRGDHTVQKEAHGDQVQDYEGAKNRSQDSGHQIPPEDHRADHLFPPVPDQPANHGHRGDELYFIRGGCRRTMVGRRAKRYRPFRAASRR